MSKKIPIFYSALLLTGVNLLLRFAGTSFQVYITNRIGAAGVGLLQLVMSVGGFAMIAGMAGIRTATMYLSAEELGKQKPENVPWVLAGSFRYSILCSGAVALILYFAAPSLAMHWIGDIRTVDGLRIYAAFLPVSCLCGVMTGLFTAENRIGTLAAVEIAEQLCSMAVTVAALTFWAGTDPVKACQSVIIGSCIGACLTLCCLCLMKLAEKSPVGTRISVTQRLFHTAVPLAAADIVKAGINTTENLTVPKQLQKNPAVSDPLASFGIVTGMVFPVIMFPACILYGLAELLIPELARCSASESHTRISYLVQRSLHVALIYGLVFSGSIYLLGDTLSEGLYHNRDAAPYIRRYALLIPMLYCDAITDAMTKGLGQQKICVRYNIITSAMDVFFLYLLLPVCGMNGYFLSFTLTHLINFLLSLHQLLKIAKQRIPFYIPCFSISAALMALIPACTLQNPIIGTLSYLASLFSLLYLFQVLQKEDILWILRLCCPTASKRKASRG